MNELREFRQQLLGQIQHFAPTQADYEAYVLKLKTYESNMSDEEKYKSLIMTLTDGLKYGNWPWTKMP